MIKRIILASAMMAVGIVAMAQQALWGIPQLKSPEVNADNTVTFRLLAPDAKEVKVTGDFLPTEKVRTDVGEFDMPGSATLTKGRTVCGNLPRLRLFLRNSTAIRS